MNGEKSTDSTEPGIRLAGDGTSLCKHRKHKVSTRKHRQRASTSFISTVVLEVSGVNSILQFVDIVVSKLHYLRAARSQLTDRKCGRRSANQPYNESVSLDT